MDVEIVPQNLWNLWISVVVWTYNSISKNDYRDILFKKIFVNSKMKINGLMAFVLFSIIMLVLDAVYLNIIAGEFWENDFKNTGK